MIEVKNLFFSYSEEKLLSNITFKVNKGEFVGLLGANGTGKTTLVKLLLGILEPQRGTIHINKSSKVAYVPQKISIERNHPAKVEEIISDDRLCKQIGIDKLLKKQFRKLSGGQQQRVLVALALENNPSILFLDEPTIGMDDKSRKEFYALLKHLSEDHGKTILVITHDDIIKEYTEKLFCMDSSHHFNARCIHD